MEAQQPAQPFAILFDSVPGRSYLILYADDLRLDWVHASGVIVASGYQTVWTTTIQECRFFQVIVLHP